MKPMACQKIYQKIAPWVSTAVVVVITLERAQTFAQAVNSQPEPSEQLQVIGGSSAQQYKEIKNRTDACKKFENQIITYYDRASYISQCQQRPIENPDVLNELTQHHGKKLFEVPARVYRLIPFGPEYTTTDLIELKRNSTSKNASLGCKKLNKKYVTANASRYFFIENCLKRPFLSYFDLENHNKSKETIVSIPEEVLDEISMGSPMPTRDSEFDILYKIDGDPNWNQLSRNKDEGTMPVDTPERLEAVDKASRNINLNELCRKINKHFVSFYSEIYFVDSCILHPIKELDIKYQRQIDEAGGIDDLTPQQMRVLKKGKAIAIEEAVKLLRK